MSKYRLRLLKNYCKNKNPIKDSIDFLHTHAKGANWDCLNDAMKILEEGFKSKPPIDDEFSRYMQREMQKQFELDMIIYCINYDGFRL